jgi:CrcB protein
LSLLLVAVGGAIGSAGRYLIGGWFQKQLGPDFPWGTFIVNATGSFAIGVILALAENFPLFPEATLFLTVGVLGSYTTFSTFGYDTLQLVSEGRVGAVLLNAFGQLFVSLGAVVLGLSLVRL